MFLVLAAASASDSGIQRLFDRELDCEHAVDPPAEVATCGVGVRVQPADDDRPTWAVAVAPPGKLFVSLHMPAIDWGHVHAMEAPRAYDPFLLTVGVEPSAVCPGEPGAGERLFFGHLASERGDLTQQACAAVPWAGVGEVLLDAHRRLPLDTWVPVWAWKPQDPERAADVRAWFVVQVRIGSTGAAPPRPPQHPYASVEALQQALPAPLPPVRALKLLDPGPQAADPAP